jgi:3-hydroxybutyrate dehydrogenase
MPDPADREISAPLKVLVTGGTGTLGEAVVVAFAKAGHQIFFQYRRNEETAARLSDTFGATAFQMDFSGAVVLPSTDFDVLVNCAGINVSEEQSHAVDPAAWDHMLRVNVTVPFLLAQAIVPGMLGRGWGRVINIGSIYSLRGATNRAPYVASKHALSGLTKVMALEYAGTGVTCNEICPSAVDSDMIDRIARIRAGRRGTTVDEILGEYRAMNPFGRMATAAEVASAVLYLSGREAGFINGASIPVDGGQTV